jgi:hypothetical protein
MTEQRRNLVRNPWSVEHAKRWPKTDTLRTAEKTPAEKGTSSAVGIASPPPDSPALSSRALSPVPAPEPGSTRARDVGDLSNEIDICVTPAIAYPTTRGARIPRSDQPGRFTEVFLLPSTAPLHMRLPISPPPDVGPSQSLHLVAPHLSPPPQGRRSSRKTAMVPWESSAQLDERTASLSQLIRRATEGHGTGIARHGRFLYRGKVTGRAHH